MFLRRQTSLGFLYSGLGGAWTDSVTIGFADAHRILAVLRRLGGLPAIAGTIALGAATIAGASIPILSDVPTLAPIVEKVIPGVVNIAVSGSVVVQNPLMADPFFRQFF